MPGGLARKQVLDLVRRYPGIHVRRVERELGLSSRLAAYHAEALEREGLLQRVQETGYSRFFPALGQPRWTTRDVQFICLMRRPVALRSLLLLLDGGPLAQGEVARRLGVARASASYHLGMLREATLVVVRQDGRERIYDVADRPYTLGMLANFTPIPDDLDQFGKLWSDLFGAGRA